MLALRAPMQYLLASLADGAVLLDLATGNFHRLNRTAACVAEGLVQGEAAALLEQRLTARFGIPSAQATVDVAALLDQLNNAALPRGDNPFRFTADAGGALLSCAGVPVCHLDAGGKTISDRAPSDTNADTVQRLLWAAPHALTLQGQHLLHAAAVQSSAGVLAFCGPSGAGKTTLARMFAEHDADLVAEDLVVLDLTGTTPVVLLAAEAKLQDWARSQAPTFAAVGHVQTPTPALLTAGPRAPLRRISFPQRETGRGTLGGAALGHTEALLLLLHNSFAELGSAEVWRHVWAGSCRLAAEVRVERLLVPEGLAVAAAAVADYRRTITG